jgi:dUTPase
MRKLAVALRPVTDEVVVVKSGNSIAPLAYATPPVTVNNGNVTVPAVASVFELNNGNVTDPVSTGASRVKKGIVILATPVAIDNSYKGAEAPLSVSLQEWSM